MKRGLLRIILAAIMLGLLAYMIGPRTVVDTEIAFNASAIGDDPAAWLAQREAQVAGIRDGLQKEIVWAYPNSRARTPLAIVYVHGFSASKGEIRPLPDIVASELGANLFYTRLAGHGQDGAALGAGTASEWVEDFAEALAIGRAIGERVVIMATSTGGGLAVWAATRPDLMENVAAMVLISPNLRIQDSGSSLLTGPWGREIAELVAGAERHIEPVNEMHGRFWTLTYPTGVVAEVAAIAQLGREAPVGQAKVPALFIISDADPVVDPKVTREIAARWGGPHQLEAVTGEGDNHVLAGDARSPGRTRHLADQTVAFIRAETR